jgi:DNA repair exonuclease SbcCD ATPase subunit
MPSQFRVAGYPPEHIYQKLKDFAKEHNLSESKALIMVLAEYFGVASNVAQEVSYKYAAIEQVEELEKNLSELSKLYSELKSDSKTKVNELEKSIKNLDSKIQDFQVAKSESLSSLENQSSKIETFQKSPGQLSFIEENPKPQKTVVNDFSVDILIPLTAAQLSRRFAKPKDFVKATKFQYKNKMTEFPEKLKKADPDGIAWEYHEDDRLYHPICE